MRLTNIKKIFLTIILLSLFSACTSTTLVKSPENQQEMSKLLADREKVNVAYNEWNTKFITFAKDIAPIYQEIRLLNNYPGWNEMEGIILARPSIIHFEGQKAANQKSNLAVENWSHKWNAPGKEIFSKVLFLIDECRELENRKNQLKEEWRKIYRHREVIEFIIYLKEYERKILSKSKEILHENYKIAEKIREDENNKFENIFNLFEIDSIGLYKIDLEKLKELQNRIK